MARGSIGGIGYAGESPAPAVCGNDKPSRESEIQEVLSYQDKAISRLEKLLEHLYQRTAPPNETQNKQERAWTPLAERLVVHNGRLRVVNDALESIIDRIEL